ncbi:MAG: hypothetical protein KF838_10420 [Phycisphaeraceae bacterium]|nr:MAG: hypothetical protein KF838_10420 [Phycisphaeraceae bacterium]
MRQRPIDPRLDSLLKAAQRAPAGRERVALLEQAADIADSIGDLDSGWQARLSLFSTSEFATPVPRLFPALAWCLAMHDREPIRFPSFSILWYMKWIVSSAPLFASLPAPAIDGLLNDLESRFVRAGMSRRGYVQQRLGVDTSMGRLDHIRAGLDELQRQTRGLGDDCRACEQDRKVEALLRLGDVDQALFEARAIIAGRLSCMGVPASTFAALLVHLRSRGETDLAARLYREGHSKLRDEVGQLSSLSRYMIHATVTGDIDRATRWWKRWRLDADEHATDTARMEFHAASAVLLTRLAQTGLDHVAAPSATSRAGLSLEDPLALASHYAASARVDARRFDLRNGNHAISTDIESWLSHATHME